jgi:hypothetical protein
MSRASSKRLSETHLKGKLEVIEGEGRLFNFSRKIYLAYHSSSFCNTTKKPAPLQLRARKYLDNEQLKLTSKGCKFASPTY